VSRKREEQSAVEAFWQVRRTYAVINEADCHNPSLIEISVSR